MTDKQRQETYAQMLVRLSRSNFRSRFHLKAQDKQYIREKGWNTIADHAADFVSKRLAPAEPKNDGKQTPMRGHPVFIAQHADRQGHPRQEQARQLDREALLSGISDFFKNMRKDY